MEQTVTYSVSKFFVVNMHIFSFFFSPLICYKKNSKILKLSVNLKISRSYKFINNLNLRDNK